MTILFFMRPAKTGEASTTQGGHYLPPSPIKESELYVLSLRQEESEPKTLPEPKKLKPPPRIKERLERFDKESQELIVTKARAKVLEKNIKLLNIEAQLLALTKEVERLLTQFEDEFLLLLIC